jgi:hypothetical protein
VRVTLDQAIEIHAKAMKYRFGKRASFLAEEQADRCLASGDREGHGVWRRVAAMAKAICVRPPSRPDGR